MTKYLQINSFNFLTRILYTFLLGDLLGIPLYITFWVVNIINVVQGYFLHKKISFNSKNNVFIKYLMITFLIGFLEFILVDQLYKIFNYQYLATLITALCVFLIRFTFLKKIFK